MKQIILQQKKPRKKLSTILFSVFFTIVGITFLLPMLWMVLTSFKTTEEVYTNPLGFPEQLMFENYPNALSEFHFGVYFTNSLFYASVSVIMILLLGSMLAYFLARFNTKINSFVMNYIVLGLVIPSSVTIVPIYLILQTINLKDTRLGLILVYVAFGIAGTVMMLFAFMRSLPKELEEAACIDGCSIYRSFFSIILPCVKPALFTRAVVDFMIVWNDFFLADILIRSDDLKTLQVGIQGFFVNMGTNEWGMIAAAMVVSSLPVIILYLIFSEQIEKAFTAGAILK